VQAKHGLILNPRSEHLKTVGAVPEFCAGNINDVHILRLCDKVNGY